MLHPGQQQERGHGPVSDMSWFQWVNLKTYQKTLSCKQGEV